MSEQAQSKKAKEEVAAEAHRHELLSTMKVKRGYETAMAALDAHYGQEGEQGMG